MDVGVARAAANMDYPLPECKWPNPPAPVHIHDDSVVPLARPLQAWHCTVREVGKAHYRVRIAVAIANKGCTY